MMDRRPLFGFSSVYFFLFVVSEVKGTLTPSDPVFLDCGSEKTFTCSVTGLAAGWTITGLTGINSMERSGQVAANNNVRITTTDTNTSDPRTSTITITDFTDAENGTVQCVELINGGVQGMTTVSVGK
jgi:hypothetical protein